MTSSNATCGTHSPLVGQVREACVTSSEVRFEPRFFPCALFSIIYMLDISFYFFIFLGQKYVLLIYVT